MACDVVLTATYGVRGDRMPLAFLRFLAIGTSERAVPPRHGHGSLRVRYVHAARYSVKTGK